MHWTWSVSVLPPTDSPTSVVDSCNETANGRGRNNGGMDTQHWDHQCISHRPPDSYHTVTTSRRVSPALILRDTQPSHSILELHHHFAQQLLFPWDGAGVYTYSTIQPWLWWAGCHSLSFLESVTVSPSLHWVFVCSYLWGYVTV